MIKINKIFVACDYRANFSKQLVLEVLKDLNLPYENLEFSEEFSFHFNNPTNSLCEKVLKNKENYGILLCGSGIGVNIAANRVKGIRSVLANEEDTSKYARNVEDVNVLCLSGDKKDKNLYKKIIENFVNTNFSNEKRHIQRIELLDL